MKKNLTQALGFCAALLLLVSSCKKDEVRTVIQPGAAPTLTASANNVVLLQTSSNKDVATYTWTPVSFGYQAAVTYSLQFDKKGGDFSAPVSFDAGSALTKTISVADLNSVYQSKGLINSSAAPTATSVDVRVVAMVGATAPTVASATTSVTATPYAFCGQPAQAWGIIGPAGISWDTDITLTYDCVAKTYSYTGSLKADEFKFRFNKGWDANLGGPSSTGGTLTQDGPNLKITTAGTYTIVLSPGTIDATTKKVSGGSFSIK